MPRSREATKRRLLTAVQTLLQQEGAEALGVNAIAAKAGVDKVLIYRYFGGLSGLLECFAESPDHLAGRRLASSPQGGADGAAGAAGAPGAADPSRALARFLLAELRLARSDPLDLAMRRAALDSESPIGRSARLHRIERARVVLEEIRTQHRIPQFLDAEAILLLLLGAVDHLALSGVTPADASSASSDAAWLRVERALERTARAVFGHSDA